MSTEMETHAANILVGIKSLPVDAFLITRLPLHTKKPQNIFLNQCCAMCGTTESPQWRKGRKYDDQTADVLCNACGLVWGKEQYCPSCFQIWKATDYEKSKHLFTCCASCGKRTHVTCSEEFFGKDFCLTCSSNLKTTNVEVSQETPDVLLN
jgi:hypothetical protein